MDLIEISSAFMLEIFFRVSSSVPLTFATDFVHVLCCFDYYSLEAGRVIPPRVIGQKKRQERQSIKRGVVKPFLVANHKYMFKKISFMFLIWELLELNKFLLHAMHSKYKN